MPIPHRRLVTSWTVAGACLVIGAAELAARWHHGAPARRGAAAAEADIAAGRPCRLGIGLMSEFGERIDRGTGLPFESHGCSADADSLRYVAAYNAAVSAAGKAGRIPDFGYAEKLTTADAIAARLDADGVAVAPGDAPLAAGDGRTRVTCVRTALDGALRLRVDDVRGSDTLPTREDPRRVVFADAGTTVYVEGAHGLLTSIDLPQRRLLQAHRRRPAAR